MSLNECTSTDVVCCTSDTPIADVASLMRTHHIGDVVVTDERDGICIPIGIVTDRDIVIETIALNVDASSFTAGDLMITPLAVASESARLPEILQLMQMHKVRRIPLVSTEGSLRGIVTADDIIRLLANELTLVADAIGEQPSREEQLRK